MWGKVRTLTRSGSGPGAAKPQRGEPQGRGEQSE